MRLQFEIRPQLPRLAWGARLRAGELVVRVVQGPWVETSESSFIEGAWDGEFAAGDFDRSAALAGSGARVTATGLRFASPANMYERLQSVRVRDELFVSNSLALLLAMSGEQLDPEHRHYYLDLLDHYRRGIRVKEKRLRLAGGRSVSLHDCCNLDVAEDLSLTRIEKPRGPCPAGYVEYVDLLEKTLGRIIENAGDARRRFRYRPLAMVSQGYDSTAVAALASRLGCREAVTFLRSHSPTDGYVDDGGEAVGRSLSYSVTTYERNDSFTRSSFRGEEFYLEPWGVDRTMAVVEEQLEGALLLSGRSGETVWSRGDSRRWGLPDLQHPTDLIPGCALGEFRLRVGFLHFAPAMISAIHAPTIHRWNASPEMRPWSIGGDYDKPIARRIAEEAGVPRHLFGQAKKGGYERRPEPRGRLAQRLRKGLAIATRGPIARALVLRTLGNRLHPRWELGSFQIQDGVAKMIERYREALDG